MGSSCMLKSFLQLAYTATYSIFLLAYLVSTAQSGDVHISSRNTQNRTADLSNLATWWHDTGVVNSKTPVADGEVRQSHLYSVQVSDISSDDYYDSFVYETIPRSGKGKRCDPDDQSKLCSEYDGITIEETIGVTMSWSQFLYDKDVVVRITNKRSKNIAPGDVTIRPTTLDFHIRTEDNIAFITVPYRPNENGARFSVEFADDLWDYQYEKSDSQSRYIQSIDPSAPDYRDAKGNYPIAGREPRNALLIFASPFPSSELVPKNDDDTYRVESGSVGDLSKVSNSVISFGPGVYWFSGASHAVLSSSVCWIYLAPGAYVKGAIQYNNDSNCTLKATGFGVLSGEKYVYQANPASSYSNDKSDATSLKMWRGENVSRGQSWILHGLTVNAAPFNAMDFYGDTEGFSIDVSDYKQVGGFYSQTDGLQAYPNSHLRDIFYHTGDDTIKTYYSNVTIERVVVWKTDNAPVIQMGWHPRNVSDVTVDRIDIIHSRYYVNLEYAPRALIGSSSSYEDIYSIQSARRDTSIRDFTISNIRSEGISPGLLGLNMLSNIDTMLVKNVWIDELASEASGVEISTVVGFTDGLNGNKKVELGSNSPQQLGLVIEDFKVGDELISFKRKNFDKHSKGQLDVDEDYQGRWTVSESSTASENSDAPSDESKQESLSARAKVYRDLNILFCITILLWVAVLVWDSH